MFHRKVWRSDAPHKPRTALRVEELEARINPYVLTGNAWPNPQLITISFVPDGTLLGYNQNGPIYSTLFNDFNSKFGSPATWQKQILLAAQSWADATNINFAVVPDSGVEIGGGTDEQGDPTIGDIRIGGFQDTGGGYLAETFMPPPANNFSIAGDMCINTSQNFNIGSTYDLFSVAAHEIGVALGMGESNDPDAVMAPVYPGRFTALTTDDIDGIQAIYSGGAPRANDAYNQGSTHNNSFANAAAFTVSSSTLTAQLTNLNISTPGMNEYFKFVAPTGSKTLNLSIQSSGLSLLSPRVWVYNSSEAQIGYLSGANTYGDTLNVTVTGLTAGKTYYIKVNGSESDALGTGLYDLSLSTGSNPVPSVTLPDTTVPDGNPETTGGTLDDTEDPAGSAGAESITVPTSPPPLPFALALLDSASPSSAALLTVLPSYEEWALHYLDHASTNPQLEALAQKVVKLAASDAAHDPALEQELTTGVVPSPFSRLS